MTFWEKVEKFSYEIKPVIDSNFKEYANDLGYYRIDDLNEYLDTQFNFNAKELNDLDIAYCVQFKRPGWEFYQLSPYYGETKPISIQDLKKCMHETFGDEFDYYWNTNFNERKFNVYEVLRDFYYADNHSQALNEFEIYTKEDLEMIIPEKIWNNADKAIAYQTVANSAMANADWVLLKEDWTFKEYVWDRELDELAFDFIKEFSQDIRAMKINHIAMLLEKYDLQKQIDLENLGYSEKEVEAFYKENDKEKELVKELELGI
ncbi:hypothetical protein [[Mycoplasma] anseris]|uniref:Uncharacterized protein n=1 Tax=[Mycoplasma] anseris TaxID=92400 RepID=A0A2Z4NCW3_9BACT|nr:hypothetical protein [[Mycoplasma] anseris]AWX69414.1 hypothetical protein DP065_01435 [[Mycoplasma] anseris]